MKKLVYLKTCRRRFILDYFDEKINFINCNNCDICFKEQVDISKDILKAKSINDINKLFTTNLEINNLMFKWRKEKLKMKFMVPKEYLKLSSNDELDDFDKFEKIYKNNI